MNNSQLTTKKFSMPAILGFPESLSKKLFHKVLSKLIYGKLTLIDEAGKHVFGNPTDDLSVELIINNENCYRDFILGGSVGAGESYIRGDWDASDLTKLIQIFSRNMEVVANLDSGISRLGAPILKLFHSLNKNTKSGSRRNIEAHYDLGNDFFETFLDESMMYSSAIFKDGESSLYNAQLNKLEVICEKLQLKESDHLLEIGTGWGSMAIYAAEKYGCRVTTTTLSKEQFKWAEGKIKEKGLESKITLLLKDYRDLEGQFDKLVSIEMVEAVGHEYMEDYLASCSKHLTPEGLFLMQVITIPDQRYESARKEIDFIKRYIFPGSCIPSVERVSTAVRKATDLRLIHMNDFTGDYEKTLKIWHSRLMLNKDKVTKLTSAEFLRMWRFYFSYCEGGFAERVIGVAHMTFAKPKALV
jgi:cyclopropane-fatty-acyl-phospholipid synthase